MTLNRPQRVYERIPPVPANHFGLEAAIEQIPPLIQLDLHKHHNDSWPFMVPRPVLTFRKGGVESAIIIHMVTA